VVYRITTKWGKIYLIFPPIIVVRLNGGLGNERRLAYVNNFHLYIDTISVFFRDKFYKKRCRLDSFSIIGKKYVLSIVVGLVKFL
jgi:hypothetical protein